MFHDDTNIPLTPNNAATLDDVNLMASAIMEHVSENERFQSLKMEDLEATVVALRQLVQQLVQQLASTDPQPPITGHRPPASAARPHPPSPALVSERREREVVERHYSLTGGDR